MKKSLLTAVALTAAGAACSQSSMTIYGIVDLGLVKMNSSASIAANPGAGIDGITSMKGAWQSRLGFRGVEDLGGGNSAFFHLEHRFAPDDGSPATPFWTGRSVVGLSSQAWGEVWMGRDYTPAFYTTVAVDPWAWNSVGQMGLFYTQANYGGTDGGPRDNNAVFYKTPNLSGLTATLSTALSENSPTRGRAVGGNAIYATGPIYLGLAFDQAKKAGTAVKDAKLASLVGSYNFGVVMPRFAIARSTSFSGTEAKSFMLGLTAPVGSGRILAGYSRLSQTGINSGKFGLGYHHDLSKRTMLYVDVGVAKTDRQGRSTGYDVGIRHNF